MKTIEFQTFFREGTEQTIYLEDQVYLPQCTDMLKKIFIDIFRFCFLVCLSDQCCYCLIPSNRDNFIDCYIKQTIKTHGTMPQLFVYLLQNNEMKTIQFQTFFREGTEQFIVKLTFPTQIFDLQRFCFSQYSQNML